MVGRVNFFSEVDHGIFFSYKVSVGSQYIIKSQYSILLLEVLNWRRNGLVLCEGSYCTRLWDSWILFLALCNFRQVTLF